MSDVKGHRLYVNLAASQVRRRLKGFGHGVRKVHSAGKNQAVVIHTATGQHLQELKAVFADVTPEGPRGEMGDAIENLRNLGPTSAAWLREVGILTRADLQRLGPAAVFRLVKQRQPKVGLNLLWAMAAGLADKDWRDVTAAEKDALRREIADD